MAMWDGMPTMVNPRMVCRIKSEQPHRLTAHSRMPRHAFVAQTVGCTTPEEILLALKQWFALRNENVCHYTVDRWDAHYDLHGNFRPDGKANPDPKFVSIYWYERLPEHKPAPAPRRITDDERWAALFKQVPSAFWLDPHLWQATPAASLPTGDATEGDLVAMTPSERLEYAKSIHVRHTPPVKTPSVEDVIEFCRADGHHNMEVSAFMRKCLDHGVKETDYRNWMIDYQRIGHPTKTMICF